MSDARRATGARAVLAVAAGLSGVLLIVACLGRWRTTEEIGLGDLRIAGVGTYGLGRILSYHPLGWVLVAVGLVLLCAAVGACLVPTASGGATAAVTTLAAGTGALGVVVALGWMFPDRMIADTLWQLGAEDLATDLSPGWGLILATVAAVLALVGGLVAGVMSAPGRWPRLWAVGIAAGAVLGVVAFVIGSWAPQGPGHVIG